MNKKKTINKKNTHNQCYDCQLDYGSSSWVDIVIPDDIWLLISPHKHGGGLLCFNCMNARLERLGFDNVPYEIASGSFAFMVRNITKIKKAENYKLSWLKNDNSKVKTDWYDNNIEKPIRNIVKLLRNNGFNTSCSCGHEMLVQCQCIIDGEIKRLHDLLFNYGYRNYTIVMNVDVMEGHQYPSINITFHNEN